MASPNISGQDEKDQDGRPGVGGLWEKGDRHHDAKPHA